MKNQNQHSPGTVSVVPAQAGLAMWLKGDPDANGFAEICRFPQHFAADEKRQRANAERLATCWNSHDELLAALEALMETEDEIRDPGCSVSIAARAAIAAAKGETL